MGVFKEEAYEFESLMEVCPSFGGFETTDPFHQENLERLRNWMRSMQDLKYDEIIDRPNGFRKDVFFIAWEKDGPKVNGTEYIVITKNMRSGFKKVDLQAKAASYSLRKFDDPWNKRTGRRAS